MNLTDKQLAFIDQQKQLQQKIVLVTGVFDLLHQEHQRFLKKAKAVGDFLVVGIESDVRVQQIKGKDRPIHNQEVRKANLETLGIADVVFILPEKFSHPSDHELLISQIQPDVLAVSSHSQHLEKKAVIVKKYGGEIKIVHQHNPKVSSTIIIERGG